MPNFLALWGSASWFPCRWTPYPWANSIAKSSSDFRFNCWHMLPGGLRWHGKCAAWGWVSNVWCSLSMIFFFFFKFTALIIKAEFPSLLLPFGGSVCNRCVVGYRMSSCNYLSWSLDLPSKTLLLMQFAPSEVPPFRSRGGGFSRISSGCSSDIISSATLLPACLVILTDTPAVANNNQLPIFSTHKQGIFF